MNMSLESNMSVVCYGEINSVAETLKENAARVFVIYIFLGF